MLRGNDIIKLVQAGAVEAINVSLNDLAGRAIAETPVEEGTLRASARYPANDSASAATADKLEGIVSFNTVYAAAQHEGNAVQHRKYAVRPIVKHGVTIGFFTDKSTIDPHVVLWVVRKHPGGGKSHYLSDPFKAMVSRYEKVIAANVEKKLEESNGQ